MKMSGVENNFFKQTHILKKHHLMSERLRIKTHFSINKILSWDKRPEEKTLLGKLSTKPIQTKVLEKA